MNIESNLISYIVLFASVAINLAVVLPTTVNADEPANLLPQGDFRPTDAGLPQGWDIEGWMSQYVSVLGEPDDAFLRIATDRGNNDKTIWARNIPLPPGATLLTASYLGRVVELQRGSAGFQTAAVEVQFLEAGEKVGQFRLHLHEQTPAWSFEQVTQAIPEGADAITVRIGFWRASGTFDVHDLKITASKPLHEAPDPPAGHEAPLASLPHEAVFPFHGTFADADSVEATGWSESPGSLGEERPPAHRLVDDPDHGRVLEIDIPSQSYLQLTRDLPVRRGKVYRVTLEARCVGQVEQIHVNRFLHHRKRLRWPLQRQWSPYVVQARANQDGRLDFVAELNGVGVFQVRNFLIEELDDFDLSTTSRPPRGELLRNGDFSLGHLDWTLRYTQRDRSPLSPASPVQNVVNAITAHEDTGLSLPAERYGMLFSGVPLQFDYGRQYTLTIHGDFEPGDLTVFLVRPGQSTHDNERFNPEFHDGVATITYRPEPDDQMVSGPTQSFALLLRHNGTSPARIASVSLIEGPIEHADHGPRVGIELLNAQGQRDRFAFRGEPVVARVGLRNVPIDETIELVVLDERSQEVRSVPIPAPSDEGYPPWIDIPIEGLSQGWYRVTARGQSADMTVISDDLAVILPKEPDQEHNGFLGMHMRPQNHAAQAHILADLGFRRTRAYYTFEWFAAQPEREGPINIPVDELVQLNRAGLEPMAVLFGTPQWASTMPEGTPGWQRFKKYPPDDMEDWAEYVRAAVEASRDEIVYYEIWNEPNGHFLHKAPDDPRSLEDIYAQLVRTAAPIIRKYDSDAKVVIGSTAGSPWFIVQTLKKHPDLLDLADAISYHPYESMYLANQGAAGFSHRGMRQQWLRDYLASVGRPEMPIIDSESGLHRTYDGPDGRDVAMLTAKGLVARQAAGFEQFYLFHAAPRVYPGQIDIVNVFGYAGRPLINAPVFATWDRILGNAQYVESLASDEQGQHVYRFQRADGHEVIVAWSSREDADGPFEQDVLPEMVMVDYLGRPLDATAESILRIEPDLRYYLAPALAKKLAIHE